MRLFIDCPATRLYCCCFPALICQPLFLAVWHSKWCVGTRFKSHVPRVCLLCPCNSCKSTLIFFCIQSWGSCPSQSIEQIQTEQWILVRKRVHVPPRAKYIKLSAPWADTLVLMELSFKLLQNASLLDLFINPVEVLMITLQPLWFFIKLPKKFWTSFGLARECIIIGVSVYVSYWDHTEINSNIAPQSCLIYCNRIILISNLATSWFLFLEFLSCLSLSQVILCFKKIIICVVCSPCLSAPVIVKDHTFLNSAPEKDCLWQLSW